MRIEASHMVVIDSYRMLLVVKIVHLNNGLVSSYPSYPNECLSKQHWIRTFFAPRNSNTETKSMDPLQSLSSNRRLRRRVLLLADLALPGIKLLDIRTTGVILSCYIQSSWG